MIAKAEWFKVRKWGGWGLTPATREGWYYIGGMIGAMALIQFLTRSNPQLQTSTMGLMTGFLVLDVMDAMIKLKKDEREAAHEAIAERNASWFMVSAIGIYIAYQAIVNALNQEVHFDPVLVGILLGAAVVKGVTYWRLRNE